MDHQKILFRVHALQQMFARSISEIEVRTVLEDGDAIEIYPYDLPHPAKLLLGWFDHRPIHVVASFPDQHTIIVVTVYEPDLSRWEPGFRKRRSP